jgi:predicted small lipoprotein YifL
MVNRLACCSRSVLVFLAMLLSIAGCDEKHPQVAAMPPPAVDVALPVLRSVSDYQVFTARTQAIQNVDLKSRVTDDHPDVKAAKRQVAELQAELAATPAAGSAGSRSITRYKRRRVSWTQW